MKILLIGEFSGVHNNLKRELKRLGHQVVLAAGGDGYRGFGYNIDLKPFKRFRPFNQLFNTVHILLNIHKLCGYDIVQFITPFVFPTPFLWLGLHRLIIKKNNKKVYYVCGGDPDLLSIKGMFKYFPHDESSAKYTHLKIRYNKWFIGNVDRIIPSMYEYGMNHRNNPQCISHIKLPIVLEEIKVSNGFSEQVRILHGVTRSNVKGSQYIINAMKRIEEDFGDEVEITIVERLPFTVYTKILERNDVLIDQCKSYSYGMNALIAMSKGLVVLSGSEPEALDYLEVEDCPVINIIPDENQIYSVLSKLIQERSSLTEIKKKSISFVTKYHNAEVIAHNFEQVYGTL